MSSLFLTWIHSFTAFILAFGWSCFSVLVCAPVNGCHFHWFRIRNLGFFFFFKCCLTFCLIFCPLVNLFVYNLVIFIKLTLSNFFFTGSNGVQIFTWFWNHKQAEVFHELVKDDADHRTYCDNGINQVCVVEHHDWVCNIWCMIKVGPPEIGLPQNCWTKYA